MSDGIQRRVPGRVGRHRSCIPDVLGDSDGPVRRGDGVGLRRVRVFLVRSPGPGDSVVGDGFGSDLAWPQVVRLVESCLVRVEVGQSFVVAEEATQVVLPPPVTEEEAFGLQVVADLERQQPKSFLLPTRRKSGWPRVGVRGDHGSDLRGGEGSSFDSEPSSCPEDTIHS